MHGNLLTLSSAADIAEIFHSFVGKEQRRVRARMTLNAAASVEFLSRRKLRDRSRRRGSFRISIYFAES